MLKKLFIVLLLLVWIAIPARVQEPDTTESGSTGSILNCEQQEKYGGETVRSSTYWSYQRNDQKLSDTYYIDYHGDIPVCNRILIDYERSAVFQQTGDEYYFNGIESLPSANGGCMQFLNSSPASGATSDAVRELEYTSRVVAQDINVETIIPTQMLLAPSFIGTFPLPVDAPLLPYDGRGFSYEAGSQSLEKAGIVLEDNRFGDSSIAEILNFYVKQLPEWELAAPEQTDFAENPMLLPGNRSLYLSLWNPGTGKILRLEFHLERNGNLRALVTMPEEAQESTARSVIEGSSQPLSTLKSFFTGWGTDLTPAKTFQGGKIASYTLQQNGRYWFVDLAMAENNFDVLYSEVVTQSSCNPKTFLSPWATDVPGDG